MQIQKVQYCNNNTPLKKELPCSFKQHCHSKRLINQIPTKIAKEDSGDFIKKSLMVVVSGAIGTFCGLLGTVFILPDPTFIVAGLGGGLVIGTIPLIKFMSNPENDVPELEASNPLDLLKCIKEAYQEKRSEKMQEKRIKDSIPKPVDNRESFSDYFGNMLAFFMGAK